jgi:hypothetical protein
MIAEWLHPWTPITEPDLARAYEDELAREVSPDHPLAGLPLVAVGQHGGTSDFLFQVDDGTGRLALVHLTWSGQRELPPWPQSMIFANVEDWIENGMRPDHDETIANS